MSDAPVRHLPATHVVATLGPATVGRVHDLVAAGMSVARLNLSHGTRATHAAAIAEVRAASQRARRHVAVLADLPGPKIRLGDLAHGAVDLVAGEPFELRPGDAPGDATGAATSEPRLVRDLEPGDRILLADGVVELRVTNAGEDRLVTIVERGGTVRSRAGVAVPAERLATPALTDQDRSLVDVVLQLGVDLVGQSFVRRASDVVELRALLGEAGPRIVAKIETRPAVAEIDGILEVADGVMVARGDLGVELPFEDVPLVQKRLVRRAIAAERPVVVATQMLESMTTAPRPTRAEASDVANAVLDGADAVMLSGETAIGHDPALVVAAAIRICRAAEASRSDTTAGSAETTAERLGSDARAVAIAAVALAAADGDVSVIGCFTRTGRTARLLAALRPRVPILAATPSPSVARTLALHRAVTAIVVDDVDGADAIGRTVRSALATRPARGGERRSAAVLVASTAGGGAGPNIVEVIGLDG